jgi:hypothetical protein
MSDDNKKANEPEKKPGEAENQANTELSKDDLSKVTGGATDVYLNIDGIKGESTDDKHKDWIEIL